MSIEVLIKQLETVEQEHWAPVKLHKEAYIRQMSGGKDLAKLIRTLEKKTDTKFIFTRVLLAALAYHGYTTFWMSRRIMENLFISNGLTFPGERAYKGWFFWIINEVKWMKVEIQGTLTTANTVTILDPLNGPLETLFGGLLTASRRVSCLNYKTNMPKMSHDLETYRHNDLETKPIVIENSRVGSVPTTGYKNVPTTGCKNVPLLNTRLPNTEEEDSAPPLEENKRIPEPKVEKPSTKDILRKWKQTLPERPSFEERLSYLQNLFTTIHKYGYKEEDLSRSFKDEALSPWVNSKSKDFMVKKSNEDYEKAIAILIPDFEIMQPKKVKTQKSSSSTTGEMDIDTALEMVTEDDELERLFAAHRALMNSPSDDTDILNEV
jgi:hypothetical protein